MAEQLASELSVADPRLEVELTALQARRQEERQRAAELSALVTALDPGRSSKERRRLFLALGLVWLTGNLGLCYLDRSGVWPIGYTELLVEGAVIVAFFGPYFFFQRRVFFHNLVNARIQLLLLLTGTTTEFLFLGGLLMDVPVRTTLALTPLLYGFGFAAVAAAVDWRLAIGAVIQLLAFFLILAWPAWCFEVLGVAGLISAATTWRWPEAMSQAGVTPAPSGSVR
ncbi:MAG: hypothetical protein AB8I08_23265 [Sandaracinaceae bacterium]